MVFSLNSLNFDFSGNFIQRFVLIIFNYHSPCWFLSKLILLIQNIKYRRPLYLIIKHGLSCIGHKTSLSLIHFRRIWIKLLHCLVIIDLIVHRINLNVFGTTYFRLIHDRYGGLRLHVLMWLRHHRICFVVALGFIHCFFGGS